MGYSVGSFPAKYLGLSLRSKAKALSIWNEVWLSVRKSSQVGREITSHWEVGWYR